MIDMSNAISGRRGFLFDIGSRRPPLYHTESSAIASFSPPRLITAGQTLDFPLGAVADVDTPRLSPLISMVAKRATGSLAAVAPAFSRQKYLA